MTPEQKKRIRKILANLYEWGYVAPAEDREHYLDQALAEIEKEWPKEKKFNEQTDIDID